MGYVLANLKVDRLIVVLRLGPLFDASIFMGKDQRTRFQFSVVQVQDELKAAQVKSRSQENLIRRVSLIITLPRWRGRTMGLKDLRRKCPGIIRLLETFITVLGAAQASYELGKHQGTIFSALTKAIGLYGVQVGLAIAVLGAGGMAYWFKKLNQWWYGAVEVVFGFTAATNITFRMAPGKPMFSQWAALVACAYVIARGLSNCAEANRKETNS